MSMKPKKLKLKKTFTPPNRDKGDESFPNGIFEFNITKMIAFINANPAQFSVEEIEVKRYAIWDAKQLNEEAADNPLSPAHCRMRAADRDLIRGGHYGQRS